MPPTFRRTIEQDIEDPGDFKPTTMRLIGELQRRVDKLERTVEHLTAIGGAQEQTILMLLGGWKPEFKTAEDVAALLAANAANRPATP